MSKSITRTNITYNFHYFLNKRVKIAIKKAGTHNINEANNI